jgi:outer membrane protein assembly factor BamB
LFNSSNHLVRSWKDFTPDRKYQAPELVYFDDDVVIFTFSNTPAEDGPRSVQCLDAKTGAVKWTLPVAHRYPDEVVRYKDGFMADNARSVWVVNKEGKIITEMKAN